jgi:hypothetical protein
LDDVDNSFYKTSPYSYSPSSPFGDDEGRLALVSAAVEQAFEDPPNHQASRRNHGGRGFEPATSQQRPNNYCCNPQHYMVPPSHYYHHLYHPLVAVPIGTLYESSTPARTTATQKSTKIWMILLDKKEEELKRTREKLEHAKVSLREPAIQLAQVKIKLELLLFEHEKEKEILRMTLEMDHQKGLKKAKEEARIRILQQNNSNKTFDGARRSVSNSTLRVVSSAVEELYKSQADMTSEKISLQPDVHDDEEASEEDSSSDKDAKLDVVVVKDHDDDDDSDHPAGNFSGGDTATTTVTSSTTISRAIAGSTNASDNDGATCCNMQNEDDRDHYLSQDDDIPRDDEISAEEDNEETKKSFLSATSNVGAMAEVAYRKGKEEQGPEEQQEVVRKRLLDPYGDGGIYTGTMLSGMRHGLGFMKYVDERVFEGNW